MTSNDNTCSQCGTFGQGKMMESWKPYTKPTLLSINQSGNKEGQFLDKNKNTSTTDNKDLGTLC